MRVLMLLVAFLAVAPSRAKLLGAEPLGACKSWCADSTKSWDKLCQKDNCASCEACAAGECKSWCKSSTKTWANLCKKSACEGCSDCDDLTTTTTTTTTTTAATTTTTTTTTAATVEVEVCELEDFALPTYTCTRPPSTCDKAAGDYFASCPEDKLCHSSGCVACTAGHHICDKSKPRYFAVCPNTKHCTARGCEAGVDPMLPYLEQCCGEPPVSECPRPPSTCDKSAGDWFATCPAGKLCHSSGCVDCPKGSHLCSTAKPRYFAVCPNDKHCTARGCEAGADPDLLSLEQCCGECI